MSFEDFQERLSNARGDDGVAGDDEVKDDVAQDDIDEMDEADDQDSVHDTTAGDEGDDKDENSDKHDRPSTLSRIKDILTGKFGKKDDTKSTDDDGDDADQEDEESDSDADASDHDDDTGDGEDDLFIDPRFINSARTYGWTDDQILAYAQKHDAREMVEMGVVMDKAVGKDESKDSDEAGDVDLISDEVLASLSEEEENRPIIDQVVKPLLAQVKELQKTLKGVQSKQQGTDTVEENRALRRDYDLANGVFDSHASEFKILGNTKDLKHLPDGTLDVRDPVVKVRGEVYQKAVLFKKANGCSMQEAMDDAMIWFRGKYGQDQMEKNLLAKIQKQSKQVSPRNRSQHKTRKFANERERRASIVQEAKERSNGRKRV